MNSDEMEDILNDLRDSFTPFFEALEAVVEGFNEDEGIAVELTCHAAPVQIEGEMDGHKLYFRSRWETWRFALADTLEEAIWANAKSDCHFYRQGSTSEPFSASWLDPEELQTIFMGCVNEFRGESSDA